MRTKELSLVTNKYDSSLSYYLLSNLSKVLFCVCKNTINTGYSSHKCSCDKGRMVFKAQRDHWRPRWYQLICIYVLLWLLQIPNKDTVSLKNTFVLLVSAHRFNLTRVNVRIYYASYYICQPCYVFTFVCLSFCLTDLSVGRITLKELSTNFDDIFAGVRFVTRNRWLDFSGIWITTVVWNTKLSTSDCIGELPCSAWALTVRFDHISSV